MQNLSFQVFGKVQGVFFRKYTEKTAKELNLVGWCENTKEGTVRGQVQGPLQSITQFKEWVSKVGSPKSKIDKCEFKSERSLNKLEFSSFQVRR